MPFPPSPQALERNLIYRSQWVNLYVDRVRFPNGTVIKKHHLLDFDQNAVMALAQDEDGRYLMVKVCRYPTGRTEWEFLAGRIEEGEDVIHAASRELLEESGYQSAHHELIYTYYPFGGIANQVFYVVRCMVTERVGSHDPAEISGVGWFTEGEIWKMIQDHEMQDGFTLASFLLSRCKP